MKKFVGIMELKSFKSRAGNLFDKLVLTLENGMMFSDNFSSNAEITLFNRDSLGNGSIVCQCYIEEGLVSKKGQPYSQLVVQMCPDYEKRYFLDQNEVVVIKMLIGE